MRTTIMMSVGIAAVAWTTSVPSAGTEISLTDFCNGADTGDDTPCIRSWIQAGRNSPTSTLHAPAGTYLYNDTSTFYSGLTMECASSATVTFRNTGGSGMFLAATEPVHGISIEECGFDVNGNPADFLGVIIVNPQTNVGESTAIEVSENRIFDSKDRGKMSVNQRQYIVLANCRDCRVEENHLSEGGRIKVGRPGRDLVIRDNIVEHVNDNAITVVDVGAGVSKDITIEDNTISGPKDIGIFIGADGESQILPGLTTRRVIVRRNRIEGDWRTACILATLPAVTDDIRITRNVCVKTAPSIPNTAGISIKRTQGNPPPATNIRVQRNTIRSTIPLELSGVTTLDLGGIVFTENYTDIRVSCNRVHNIGPRAIRFRDADIEDARIVRNTMVGGNLSIDGTVAGTVETSSTGFFGRLICRLTG